MYWEWFSNQQNSMKLLLSRQSTSTAFIFLSIRPANERNFQAILLMPELKDHQVPYII